MKQGNFMNRREKHIKQLFLVPGFVFLVVLIISCQKEYDVPTGNNKVGLAAVTMDTISYFHAFISTRLESTGNNTIKAHGFCWSTHATPDISVNYIDLGEISTETDFSSVIVNLLPNQKYYIRAFASIQGGTVYGPESEFTTLKTGK